jgi:capsular exopolysaccharide synthesis family protein
MNELMRRLAVTEPPPVKVEIPANTELLKVTVEGGTPESATLAAATLGEILVAQLGSGTSKVAQDLLRERLAQLEREIKASEPGPAVDGKKDAYSRLLEEYERASINEAARASSVAIVEPAVPPLAPARPNRTLNLALGLLIGLVAGIGLSFLFESLDTRLHSVTGIQALTGLPILGIVPSGSGKTRVLFDERSPQQEAVRRLRAHLLLPDRGGALKTVMVTSAEPGEGKSTILANLAVSLGRAKKNVLIVDADLRLPTVHQFFEVSNETGLSRILQGQAAWIDEVRYVPSAGVWVLPSGPMPRNPAELLGSPAMGELLEALKAKFEMVLIDSPSLLAVADGSVLTTHADAVVLVVAQGHAKAEAVRAACQELANVGVEPLVIVNRANHERVYGYYPQATHAQGA